MAVGTGRKITFGKYLGYSEDEWVVVTVQEIIEDHDHNDTDDDDLDFLDDDDLDFLDDQ